MRVKPHILLLLILVLLTTTRCGRKALPFEDDFSDPSSGWGPASGADFTRGYVQGRYQIEVDRPGLFVWTVQPRHYRDLSVSITAIAEGNPDNHYGLICRAGKEGFYYFAVSTDGYYGIFRVNREGELHPLIHPGMRFTPLLSTGENHLRAECVDSRLSFYINGERATDPVEDESFTEGGVGFGAGLNVKEGSVTLFFDDFEAIPLGEE